MREPTTIPGMITLITFFQVSDAAKSLHFTDSSKANFPHLHVQEDTPLPTIAVDEDGAPLLPSWNTDESRSEIFTMFLVKSWGEFRW